MVCAYEASVIAGAIVGGVHAVGFVALAAFLVCAAYIDASKFVVPNALVLVIIVVRAVLVVIEGMMVAGASGGTCEVLDIARISAGCGESLDNAPLVGLDDAACLISKLAWRSIAAGLVVSVPSLVIALALEIATGRPALGGGDIKLLFAVGTYFTWEMSIVGLLLSCLAAVVLSVTQRVRNALRTSSAKHSALAGGINEISGDVLGGDDYVLVGEAQGTEVHGFFLPEVRKITEGNVIPFGVAIACGFLVVVFAMC